MIESVETMFLSKTRFFCSVSQEYAIEERGVILSLEFAVEFEDEQVLTTNNGTSVQ